MRTIPEALGVVAAVVSFGLLCAWIEIALR